MTRLDASPSPDAAADRVDRDGGMNPMDVKPPPVRAKAPPVTPLDEAMRERVRAVCEAMRSSSLAKVSGYSEESIRRYMTGHKPAVAFLARVCHAFQISLNWMMLGEGASLVHPGEACDQPGAMEEQLRALTVHLEAIQRDIDHVARSRDGRTRGGRRSVDVEIAASVEGSAKPREIRELRLLLGPADALTVPIEEIVRTGHPIGDEVVIRLDTRHPRARLVAPGDALEPEVKTDRYEKYFHEGYLWTDRAPAAG